MHSSLVLLTVCSIILIILMITCFICFIRSRRKEDEELMERVQYNNAAGRHQQLQFGGPDPHQQQQMVLASQRQMMANQSTPQRQKQLSQSPSENMLIINDSTINQMSTNSNHESQFSYDPSNPQASSQMMADYQAARSAGYNVPASSPYHNMGQPIGQPSAQRQETRSDITQQINSAIIGSSEAEFQNDFIQVFPMYQIAPQPEKNTTPYLT